MIHHSKVARRVAAANRSVLGYRHHTTISSENDTSGAQHKQLQRRIREPEAEAEVGKVLRRIRKAERDERMDITMSLTEVKTYEGGFTRPRQLRSSNWWPGGAYHLNDKSYEPPSPAAYIPHTVFLVESRHPIRHEPGRPEALEHFVGVCREEDFPAVMERINSSNAPVELRSAMDNARWPWLPPKHVKRTKWMDKDETLQDIMRRLEELDEREAAFTVVAKDAKVTTGAADRSQNSSTVAHVSKPYQRRHSRQMRATELLMPQRPSGRAQQRRVFHFSMHSRADNSDPRKLSEGPGTSSARAQIPTSTWSRPHKPSQDADDNVVPTYYIERKRQRTDIAERKEEEGGLMAELNAGILSEGLAAETKARDEKIPVEVRIPEEGRVMHPSGFQPPTAETEFHPTAAKTPTGDHPLVDTIKQRWDERPVNHSLPGGPDYDQNVELDFARRIVRRVQADPDAAEVLQNPEVLTHPVQTQQGPAGTVEELDVVERSSHEQRAQIPTSAWDSPDRRTSTLTRRQREESTREDVVPVYYVERRRQRDSIEERKEEEGGLMTELNAGILSEGLAAETRHREEKIPVEVFIPKDGTVRHPSGFEPPTPETEFHPKVAKTATEDSPIVTTMKVPWTEAASVTGSNNGAASANKKARGIHTSAILRALAVSDSVFGLMSPHIMPTPTPVREPSSQSPSTCPQDAFDAQELEEDEPDVNIMGNPDLVKEEVKTLRSQYLPTLDEKPFWRPLVTVTLQTRPLALTLSRLSRAKTRGMPFIHTVDLHDRKYGPSVGMRLRNMRLNRTHELALDIARILRGERGGVLGIRWSPEDKGRGIDSEGLACPIPVEKRMVKVGLGEWYKHSSEWKEIYAQAFREAEVDDALQVFGLDQHGNRTDGKAWPKPMPDANEVPSNTTGHIKLRRPGIDLSQMDRLEQEKFRVQHLEEYKWEIAMARARSNPSVMRP